MRNKQPFGDIAGGGALRNPFFQQVFRSEQDHRKRPVFPESTERSVNQEFRALITAHSIKGYLHRSAYA
jgi:hypothetical protein